MNTKEQYGFGYLLSTKQTKMEKSLGYGYLSVALHLKSNVNINGLRTCPHAGMCAKTCLDKTGRLRLSIKTLLARTKLLATNPDEFMRLLHKEIIKIQKKAIKLGLVLTIRLNGTSDISWELYRFENGKTIFEEFPTIQFIDYTKSVERWLNNTIPNYYLTYSWSENSDPAKLSEGFAQGKTVARPFVGKLPTEFEGRKVIDGDKNDLRHLDEKSVWVGLRYKKAIENGKAIKPKSGFLTILQ